ncbi:nitrate- and nitrite sensing domain-containing protein [Micromonospora sp. WMMD1082]|uniref:sensor histidine kinase n=1 Tax=Micromonospora sp. WMMD1082 TaxID=3016104 RepID=UPI00241631A0|nr:nitrate- and nitrite sensing domain-containing protein [Micromonospora sp. WMMD1082]MDG4796841.1 nitrate- and nitrite sensing domain-containing protein [Micromonospora sp. WMMD1082]
MGVGPEQAHGVSQHRRRRFDVRVVPHRRRSPLRLQDWRMRTKLATVLVIPSVAFLVLAGVQTQSLVSRASTLGDFAAQVGIGREITALTHRLQQERDRTAGELPALRASGEEENEELLATLQPYRDASDQAAADLREAAVPLAEADASWRDVYVVASQAYQQIGYIRNTMTTVLLSDDTILGNYHRAVDALLALLAQPTPGADRPELSDAVLRYVQFARAKELSSRVRAELYAAARAGSYDSQDAAQLPDLRARQLTALGAFRIAATGAQVNRYDQISLDPAFVAAARMEEQALSQGTAGSSVLNAEQWWNASEERHELLQRYESEVLAASARQADDASETQLRETLLVVGVIITVLMVALVISVLIGRSLARSIRLLRSQALRIAQIELPEALSRLRSVSGGVPPIEVSPAVVRSLDEIGELAEAFVAVHRSAVGVAVEQATMRRNVNAMFVNLARRSQVLVERQLELLDDLEREEGDPEQLENLFKLDHLAARMRRNDESLLVLAGTESTRRWNRPVGLSAVLLAASAEIEQYQRVRHEAVADLHVVGHAVGELVHLLAELLENATAFSRPDTIVQVMARAEGPGAVIEIADQGLGMSPTALAEANAVLAAPPTADVATVERMGLFVVSHLAARHGIEVRLHGGAGGLVVRVRLPGVLLAAAPPPSLDPAPSPRGLPGATPRPGAPRNPGPADLPVAGRRPTTVPRQARPVPVRAEDVLAPAVAPAAGGGGWWSREGPSPVVPAVGAGTPAPPAVPVTAGTNERGLPVRVPMAQLSAVTQPARPEQQPVPRPDPDPEAVGGMLSRLYSGVRQAEAEETTEIPMPPPGVWSEGGRR